MRLAFQPRCLRGLQLYQRPVSARANWFSGIHHRGFSSAAVSATLVKQLRERTGASMGKCRSALLEESGDIEKAVEWLRKKGIKSMEKRSTDSAEALLAISVSPSSASIVEIRAETDFVTRSALFQQLIVSIASTAASSPVGPCVGEGEHPLSGVPLSLIQSVDQPQLLEKANVPVGQAVLELGSVLGERLVMGRNWQLESSGKGSVVAGYVHPSSADSYAGTGKMAAIVALKPSAHVTEQQLPRLQTTADKLARHIVASQPRYVSVESIPKDALDKEQALIRAAHLSQMDPDKAAKLDDSMLQKVIDGKTKKFYQDCVLLKQDAIIGGNVDAKSSPSVEVWLAAEAKEIGVESLVVEGFHLACL